MPLTLVSEVCRWPLVESVPTERTGGLDHVGSVRVSLDSRNPLHPAFTRSPAMHESLALIDQDMVNRSLRATGTCTELHPGTWGVERGSLQKHSRSMLVTSVKCKLNEHS